MNIERLVADLSEDIKAYNALVSDNAGLVGENKRLNDVIMGLNSDRDSTAAIIDKLKAGAQTKKPYFGINTHLWSDASYADVDKVIAGLNYLNIKFIRQDFDVYGSGDSIGKMLQHDKWVAYKPKFDAAGIKVRPMFYMRGTDGFATFKAIAALYPYFDEIEIGNESAVDTKNATMKDGQKASEYDAAKLDKATKYIFAAYKALLSADHPIKPITSITWVHYYFIHALRNMGCNMALSVHSYTDGFWNVGNRPYTKGLNAWQAALREFGPMVFEIGETGHLPSDVSLYTDALQLEKGTKIINDTYLQGVPIIFFELFDRIGSKGREGILGVFRTDWTPKPLADYIKQLLK